MKLSGLKAFVAAVEEGSLRAAARRLGLSQPAVTRLVRELEVELSASLFTRTTVGVAPTAQGKALHARALAIQREIGAAVDEINQLGGHFTGELNVGAMPLAVMLLMPETLRTFSAEFPQVQIRLSEELYFSQLQKLRMDQMDVAVCTMPEGLPLGEFIVEELITTCTVVVVRRGSPLAQAKSLGALAGAKWVYTGPAGASGYAQLFFAQHGLPAPPVGAVVNSTLGLLALVGGGDFVGLMPRHLIGDRMFEHLLEVVPLKEAGVPMKVCAIARNDASVSPVVRHFMAHLHRAAHQLAQPRPAI
ncbi:LysR family transcriptional regulator [Rhodoferax koreense]|uniref:LysR family transcriptional regulator n=1 Tax=Rhodoferax koreensis TaxID=1842727 RepID=A0A1P8K338_9BURK|nr:LysR substrate-binding domain-containing protein [Rhodoferax koreense]APW40341.1 LysR family transcriptional regulator [Rhodoferax koreense]